MQLIFNQKQMSHVMVGAKIIKSILLLNEGHCFGGRGKNNNKNFILLLQNGANAKHNIILIFLNYQQHEHINYYMYAMKLT
jgi:hypothetical protein